LFPAFCTPGWTNSEIFEEISVIRMILAGVAASTLLGCAPVSQQSSKGAPAHTDPNVITTAEIDAADFRDAYDIVNRLRPSWFSVTKSSAPRTLGGIQVSESSSGMTGVQSGSASSGIVVYLDKNRLGGSESLHDLPPKSIGSLRYLDGATASATLPGLSSTIVSGAIVATSRIGH
jgi:hypothetical protein